MNKKYFPRITLLFADAAPAWIALIIIFLFAGITSHDPWKQDETYSFGIIYHFYTHHTWLIPVNAGRAFMEKPPLYYWTAVLFCKAFGGVLALHNAARMASFFYMLIATWFTWQFSQVLRPVNNASTRRNFGWITLLLFLGMPGMARHAHDMFTDVALLAGASIAFYGLALWVMQKEKCRQAGFWFGLGFGITFLSKGLFIPVTFVAAVTALFMLLPALHTRKSLHSASVALAIALPFLVIWPVGLYCESPHLFLEWLWDNNIGRFLGFSVHRLGASNEPFYFVKALLWFAFPLFPLACITLWRLRHEWRNPQYLLPVCLLGSVLLFLVLSASGRALYLIPLMPVFSVLAAQAFDAVPPRILRMWNNMVRLMFTLGAMLMIFTWWVLIHQYHSEFLQGFYDFAGQWLPLGYKAPYSQWPTVIMVITVALFWLLTFRLHARSHLTTARIGFAGIALLWCCHLLLLPWVDETRSYRPVIEALNTFLRQSPYHDDCINNVYLGESIAPMLEYFGDRHEARPSDNFDRADCHLILTDAAKDEPENINMNWMLIWKQSRPLDTKNREVRLYARKER